MGNNQMKEEGSPPFHEWAIPYLQSIADKYSTRTGSDLELGQAEFRGAVGMLLCNIPKGCADIRDTVRNFALQLDMIGDETVEKVDDHLLREKEQVRNRPKSDVFAAAKVARDRCTDQGPLVLRNRE